MRVVAAVIVSENKVLACRRGPHKSLAGAWEFPGGKVEPHETDAIALAREIAEELNVEITVGRNIAFSSSNDGLNSIEMYSYICELISGNPTQSTDHDRLLWVEPSDLGALHWAKLDIPVVAAVKQQLNKD